MPIIAIIGGFLPGLFGKQLSYKAARIAGFVILGVAILALLAMAKCAYDRSIINDHDAKREAAASGARETSANERVKDAVADSQNEKEAHDAITSAPTGGSLSPAAHALSCKRLRDAGRIPPACRPTGGN